MKCQQPNSIGVQVVLILTSLTLNCEAQTDPPQGMQGAQAVEYDVTINRCIP